MQDDVITFLKQASAFDPSRSYKNRSVVQTDRTKDKLVPGKLTESKPLLMVNVNCDNAFLPSNIHESLHITVRDICQRLIANYTCSSRSKVLKRIARDSVIEIKKKITHMIKRFSKFFSKGKKKPLNDHVLMEFSLLEDKVTSRGI